MVSVFQQQESAVVGAGRDAARLPPMPHSVAARPRGPRGLYIIEFSNASHNPPASKIRILTCRSDSL